MPHVSTNVLKVGTGLQNSPGQFVDATPYHFSTLPQFDWEGTNDWEGRRGEKTNAVRIFLWVVQSVPGLEEGLHLYKDHIHYIKIRSTK